MTSNFLQVGRTMNMKNAKACPKKYRCPYCNGQDYKEPRKAFLKRMEKVNEKMWCDKLHLHDLQGFLPMFIQDEFPKGQAKDRGAAILHVALFLDWCKKNVK